MWTYFPVSSQVHMRESLPLDSLVRYMVKNVTVILGQIHMTDINNIPYLTKGHMHHKYSSSKLFVLMFYIKLIKLVKSKRCVANVTCHVEPKNEPNQTFIF